MWKHVFTNLLRVHKVITEYCDLWPMVTYRHIQHITHVYITQLVCIFWLVFYWFFWNHHGTGSITGSEVGGHWIFKPRSDRVIMSLFMVNIKKVSWSGNFSCILKIWVISVSLVTCCTDCSVISNSSNFTKIPREILGNFLEICQFSRKIIIMMIIST